MVYQGRGGGWRASSAPRVITRTMRTAHLFAGAGGGLLADLILGHTPIVAVEWDPYACAVLRERFPGTRVIEGDVRSVDFARELAGVDAICAGFPCQDISAAGKGAGITGERSGLYREVMRAVDAVRPAWVFLENSPNIRTKGRHIVIGDLVARGYAWRDGRLAASDVGAPHRRMRWWCLAKRTDSDDMREPQPQGSEQDQRGRVGDMGSEVADSVHQRLEISGDAGGIPEAARTRIRPTAAGGGWWSAEPGMGRMAHGVAHRTHRIKCLGNGQVPLCAALAWKLLGGP